MKGKLRALVCAALCVALSVGAANASVTINGKSLNDIDDIVMETTGSHIVRQESLLKVLRWDDGGVRFISVKGDVNGSNASLSQSGSQNLDVSGESTNTGAHPAVGTKMNSDGSFFLLVPSYSSSGVKASIHNVITKADSSITHTKVGGVTSVAGGNAYVTDATGGLFPYGKDGKEVFVIAYFTSNDNKRPGLGTNYTAYLVFVDTDGKKVGEQRLGNMVSNFPSVSVATGDFNNDGTNELAVIRDGSGMDYYLQVFSVGSSGSSLAINPLYSTPLGTRDSNGNNIDACDVAAGDFNGDGKTDLAVVYSSMTTDKNHDLDDDGCPTVTTFRWSGSGFTTSTTVDTDSDLITGSDNWKRSSSVPHYGLIAEAGDLNGDGKDEIVFLTPSYGGGSFGIGDGGVVLVSVWGADNDSLTPSRMFWKSSGTNIFGYGGTMGESPSECNYLPRSISLALAPVGDALDTGARPCRVFISRSQGDDKVYMATGYKAGDTVFYMKPELSGASLTGLSDSVEYEPGSKGRAMGLVHADFYNQTVELGTPDHLVYEAEPSYVVELQTPPYHVDYVKVDFPVNNNIPTEKQVLNMTYMGSSSTYKKSDTETTKQDVAFNTTSTFDWGVNANGQAKVKCVKGKMSGGYKDIATNVQNTTSSSEARTTVDLQQGASLTDSALLYKTDRHVWRYPVLSYVNPEEAGKPDNANGKCFMTFSLCDTPTVVESGIGQSSDFDGYNPSHEEGNLFSYPTMIEHIPYYGTDRETQNQCELTNQVTTSITGTGASSEIKLNVSQSHADSNGTTTKSKKTANGSVNVSIGIPKFKVGAGATVDYARELTNTETFTKSYTSNEMVNVVLNASSLAFDSKKIEHNITTQLYTDVAGIMRVGFAVDLKSTTGGTAEVWRSGGMYDTSPDIALVLPARFSRYTSNIDNVKTDKWIANDYRPSAIQLRGIHFADRNGNPAPKGKDQDGNPVTALVRGKTYNISIPVYNASFKAPEGSVTAEMQLRVMDTESAAGDEIILNSTDITPQTFTIGGWTKGTEDNKAVVSFDLTVPKDIDVNRNYVLYFILDPENVIDELHEDWDIEKDPAGNNVGCYPIGILEEDPPAYYTASSKVSTAASESDFEMVFQHPGRRDGEWISLEQFRTELAEETDDFRGYAKVSYKGSETLANMYLDVIRLDSDGRENRIASRIIPALHPDMERESSFLVSPEKVKKGTFCVSLTGGGVNLHWGRPSNSGSGGSGSSGGCDTGLSGAAVLVLLTFAALLSSRAGKR